MKKVLLVTFVALLLVGALADALLRSFAEERATKRVAELLELDGDPQVSLEGWPFIVRLLAGSFPSASMRADGVTARGVRLQTLRIELEDVRFSAGKLLAGDTDAVTAERGSGTARLSEEALGSLVEDRYPDADVTIRNSRIRVNSPQLPGRARGRVGLRDGSVLVIGVRGLPQDIEVPLPRIVDGLTYDSVSISDDALQVGFNLRDARLISGE